MSNFKQTEVGLIPEDWEVKTLTDIGVVIDGDRGINYPKNTDFTTTGYCLFLSARNVTKNGFKFDDCQFISVDVDKKLNKGKLSILDIVLTTRGTVGNFAFYNTSIIFNNIRINSGMVIIRIERNFSHDYFYSLCNSNVVTKQIERLIFGSAQPQLTVKGILTFQLPIPPTLQEQTSIATALSDTDALITSLEKLIAKKRNIKQGAMQELLRPKEGWEVKKLGDLVYVYSGGTPSTNNSNFYGGNIFWITSGDLNKKNIHSVDGRITKLGLENSSAKMVNENTLLIALYGATAGVTAITKIKAAINQAVLAIIPKNTDVDFLYYKITSLKDWIINTYTQGGQPNLSGNIIKSIELEIPNEISEQTMIASILLSMDTEITALETKLSKYKQIKQGMMQNLLTGKIRLV